MIGASLSQLGLWLVFGFVVAAAGACAVLIVFDRIGVRQQVYEDAPETHRAKTGTPTMGGIAIVAAFSAALLAVRSTIFSDLIFLIVVCAGIGAIDDATSIARGSNRGLRARTKFLATALVAAMFLRLVAATPGLFPRDVLFHAGTMWIVAPHWLWLLLGILAITATIHAVNLTDGLDGLAAGTMIPPLIVFAIIASALPSPAAAIACAIGTGACGGFLLFNRYPAKLFMGDTGSLALGALLSGAAILTGQMLLLLVVGGVFVAEAFSVVLQVSYFKATGGRRIFKMSPLHHHFEMLGWPEIKVTGCFWLASLLCSLLGWVIVR